MVQLRVRHRGKIGKLEKENYCSKPPLGPLNPDPPRLNLDRAPHVSLILRHLNFNIKLIFAHACGPVKLESRRVKPPYKLNPSDCAFHLVQLE